MKLKIFKIKHPFLWLDDYPAYNERYSCHLDDIVHFFKNIQDHQGRSAVPPAGRLP